MPCDAEVTVALPSVVAVAEKPQIVTGRAVSNGVELAGAKVTWLSTVAMDTWAKLLARPEDADDWAPDSLGATRVERLSPSHIYQQTDFVLLGGIVTIRRQAVVGIVWQAQTPTRFTNCWYVDDPAGYASTVKAWDNGQPWVYHGQGGWDLKPQEGGIAVSYAFWAEAQMMLPQVQAWAMSRTLPELSRAFEAHARNMAGG